MGMNYYLHEGACPTCGHCEKKTHIGKACSGWTFSFRGYCELHDMPKILTYAGWLTHLAAAIREGNVICDDEGRQISLAEFGDIVEAHRFNPLNHTTYCQDRHPEADRYNWLDPDGNSFTGTEFS